MTEIGGGGGERRENAAAVEPADALLLEELLPIHVAGRHLRGGRPAAIGAADGAAQAVAALGEVQADARIAADAVEGRPLDVGEIDAALQHQVFQQAADIVLDDGGDHGGAQAEAAAQTADDVVLAAAFPDLEAAGGAYAAFAGIEAEHDFAEGGSVPAAALAGFDGHGHGLLPSPDLLDQVDARRARWRRCLCSRRP